MLSRWDICRPHVQRTHGRRLYIDGIPPERMDAEKLRNVLERALPHLKNASLFKLIREYWLSGEPYCQIKFRYYP